MRTGILIEYMNTYNHTNYSIINFLNEFIYDLINIKKNKNVGVSVLINQIYFTGYEAFSIVALLSLLISSAIIQQGLAILVQLGQSDLLYKILVSVTIRDLGPLLTSFIILARSGTAISTELGNMRVNKEIDMLKSFGISPITYIVTPRVIGMVLSMQILILYFAIIGIFGGYIVSTFFRPIAFAEFFSRIIKALTFLDLFLMLFKVTLAGLSISLICSFHGLNVGLSSTEVPQRNIKAVAHSVYAVLLVNLLGVIIFLSLN